MARTFAVLGVQGSIRAGVEDGADVIGGHAAIEHVLLEGGVDFRFADMEPEGADNGDDAAEQPARHGDKADHLLAIEFRQQVGHGRLPVWLSARFRTLVSSATSSIRFLVSIIAAGAGIRESYSRGGK